MNQREVLKGIAEERHKRAVQKFPRQQIISLGVNHVWAIDLAEMESSEEGFKGGKKQKKGAGYHYILVVIDVFSRYVSCVALKTKQTKEVMDALKQVIEKEGKPQEIISDRGSEFINKDITKYFEDNKISLVHLNGQAKASNAERFIRTLKHMISIELDTNMTHDWVSILQDVVKEYNNTKHSVTRMTPTEAKLSLNEEKLMPDLNLSVLKPKFQLGDKVRVSYFRDRFDKGHFAKWSLQIFTVVGIRYTNPITYKLENEKGQVEPGSYYEQELQKTKFPETFIVEKILDTKKVKGQVMKKVKWFGYDEPTWEPEENINYYDDKG